MRHLVRSVTVLVLPFLLASALYSCATSILHAITSVRLAHTNGGAVMLGVIVAVTALSWFLDRRYQYVQRIALFMLGLAAFRVLDQMDCPWLIAVAGCLALTLAARVWYRRTHPLARSARSASASEGWRDSYFRAVYPRAAPPVRPLQAAMPGSAPDPVRTHGPAYSFDELAAKPRFDFSSIVGMTDTKSRLLSAAREVIGSPDRARNGILLFGEPGNFAAVEPVATSSGHGGGQAFLLHQTSHHVLRDNELLPDVAHTRVRPLRAHSRPTLPPACHFKLHRRRRAFRAISSGAVGPRVFEVSLRAPAALVCRFALVMAYPKLDSRVRSTTTRFTF
jgi:hypothetical protein